MHFAFLYVVLFFVGYDDLQMQQTFYKKTQPDKAHHRSILVAIFELSKV